MKILGLFLWVLVPIGVWWTFAAIGTPHLVLSYRFHDNGDVHNPLAPRHYIDCTYLGWHGAIRIPAHRARCPWVRLIKVAPQ